MTETASSPDEPGDIRDFIFPLYPPIAALMRVLDCRAAALVVSRMLRSAPHQTPASFRDAPLGAGPESILPVVVMDSGLAQERAPE
jgi:hypothetical protein